jgi:hypothetical protein
MYARIIPLRQVQIICFCERTRDVSLSSSAKVVAQAVRTFLVKHPIGQIVSGHVLGELVDAVGHHLTTDSSGKLPAATDGHPHLHSAITASRDVDQNAHLTNAYRGYAAHTQGHTPSYNNFSAHYWAGVTCLVGGDVKGGREHLTSAYRSGVALLDSPEPSSKDDPEWDLRLQVAEILDHIERPLGVQQR